MSYKHDGRIPRPRNPSAQRRDTSPSANAALPSSKNASSSRSPRPQVARPMERRPTVNKAASFSGAEENRRILAPSEPPPSNHARQSFLPRPAGYSSPLTSDRPPSAASRATPAPSSCPQTPKPDTQSPVNVRPRNVLRRKPPTIGQYTENGGSRAEAPVLEKLSVVIPSGPSVTRLSNTVPQTPWDHADSARQTSSQSVSGGTIPPKMPTPEPQAAHGPKELASLRTVNTQNLPPPTPSIPTASSPSTRYSGSPGIWSRTSTPTSLSSCSPGVVHSAKMGQRLRQPSSSQTRLPVFSPPVLSSPQGDRPDPGEPNHPNLAKHAESNPSPLKTEIEGLSQGVDTTRTFYPSGNPPCRKSSLGSNQSTRPNADSKASKRTVDEAERRVFEPRRPTRAKTADPTIDSMSTPSRPSREGTHQLELEPSPVIRSSLSPHMVSGHKRRESAESLPTVERPRPTPSQAAAVSVDSLQSGSSFRIPSRTTPSPVMSRGSPQTLGKEETQKQEAKNQTKPKRFGLFAKKPRTEVDWDQAKPTRKGPAAGTGYEGYGKYGQPGRRSSASSNGSGRWANLSSGTKAGSTSKENRKSRPDLNIDDFLRDRLQPVVINGGGIDGASLSRAQSEESASGTSTVSSNTADLSKASRSIGYSSDSVTSTSATTGQQGLSDSTASLNALRKESPSRPGTGSDDGKAPGRPRILRRKSSRCADKLAASSPSIDGHNSSVTALPQTTGSFQPANPASGATAPNERKGTGQKRKGSRWNFFQRSRGKEKRKPNAEVDNCQLPVAISPAPTTRPVAHYAFVGDGPEPLDDIIHRVEESPPTEDEGTSEPVEAPAALNIKKVHESVLLPSPPQMQGEFSTNGLSPSKVFLNKDATPAPVSRTEDKRQSRLEAIGRIPQVISRRDREHKPAQKSFSRPFSTADSPAVPASVADQQDDVSNNVELSMHRFPPPTKPIRLGYNLTQPFGDPAQANAIDFLSGPYSNNEFLRFSRQMGSQHSSSSDSGRLSAMTAAMPKPSAETTADEVWGEYDDLIDKFSPEVSKSAGPRAESDEKFEMTAMANKTLQAELNGNAEIAPRIAEPAGTNDRTSSESADTVRLRRSRIISALQSPNPPSSQPSYSDIIAAYSGDGGENVDVGYIDRKTPPKKAVGRQSSVLLPQSSGPAPDPGPSRQRNNALYDIAESDHGEQATAQTNLRSGSLMTSRWLSFGRVLFSPAHNHMKCRDQQRILVIDGLGNDDWSFYCSLTYPNAEVYSLSMAPATTASANPAAWKPPTNHHTIHHANLERSFPFPKGYFSATILRFPAACSEKMQDNVISECKRVLRPGGYLEMGIMDLDMEKMGARTRKAVRKLKERTYLADPNISLKPASDNIQLLLGRHRFDNLRRCMVRIPVAGMIVRSSGSSSSTSNSNQSTWSARPKPPASASTDQDNTSLGDLLSDPAPSASNDESIRKIVAKVARWWFSRCYEVPVQSSSPDGPPSIWTDRKLLRECQKTGTGFRLLIAYAQKPSEKRRTASV